MRNPAKYTQTTPKQPEIRGKNGVLRVYKLMVGALAGVLQMDWKRIHVEESNESKSK
jgi:hypothetical protein